MNVFKENVKNELRNIILHELETNIYSDASDCPHFMLFIMRSKIVNWKLMHCCLFKTQHSTDIKFKIH